jgi:hypothetical protein
MKMMVADLINGTLSSGRWVSTTGTTATGTSDLLFLSIVPFSYLKNTIGTTGTISFLNFTDQNGNNVDNFNYIGTYNYISLINGEIAGFGEHTDIRKYQGSVAVYPGTYGTVYALNKFIQYRVYFLNEDGHGIFAGTSEDNLKLYRIIQGTNDITINEYVSFMYQDANGNTPNYHNDYESNALSYTNAYLLPEQSGYNPYFTEEKVKHKLDNGKTLTYFKGFNFNADINFEQISGTELSNLKEIKNLKTNLRFFPNIAEKPNLSYDVIWDNDFNYPFTVPTYTGGGYNGNIHFEGITRLGSIGDTI